MPTFPSNQNANGAESLTVCSDPACTILAPIMTAGSSQLIPGSVIAATPNGLIPFFSSSAYTLYALDATGRVITLSPVIGGTPVTVTGSRSSGAAVSNLIAALVAQGLPFTDGTSS